MRYAGSSRTSCGRLLRGMAEANPRTSIPPQPKPRLPIGISDCLLGANVRFDGGHKKSAYPHDELEGLFHYRGICPEMGIGLGAPRASIRLVGDATAPQAIMPSAGDAEASRNLTAQLAEFARSTLPELDSIAGYVFMKSSPSCGLFRVKVYGEKGIPQPTGRGIYANVISQGLPNLPVEESGRLQDAVLRENFVTRVFVYAHWQALRAGGLNAARLIEFHARYKYLVMAHSIASYKSLGRLLSDLSVGLDRIADEYIAGLMQGLSQPATRGGHANVLSHLQGYVKHELSSADRQELAGLIDQFRQGSVPLLAAISLLQHHLRRHGGDYALGQIYLDPHPANAGLRRVL